jgi:integrase
MNYSGKLEREKQNVRNLAIPQEAKAAILGFISDMTIEGLSPGRLYAYTLRLRIIASNLQEKFSNPSEQDIKDFITGYMNHKTTWGGNPRVPFKQSSSEETVKGHKPSDNSLQGYQVTFKKFYKWYLGHNDSYPDCVRWIKIKTPHRSKQKKPESVISETEMKQLLDACMNMRDKALISLLYDSGCRISELLTMNRKDLAFDQYGAKITVSGKTGVRVVRIMGDSVVFLRDWLKIRPDQNNSNFPLFTRLDGNVKERMQYEQVHALFRKVIKRAGLERRIYPHLFRHTRATLLSMDLKEPVLEKTMGWVHGSKMSQVYVHLDDSDVDSAILKSHGVKVAENNKGLPTPKVCNRCGELNPSDSTFCRKCWLPFDIKTALDQEAKEKEIQEALTLSPDVDPVVRSVIENMPDETKYKLLESILKGLQVKKTPK